MIDTPIATHHRYVARHNGAILYFILDPQDGEERMVTLNANATCGCQHNGVQECSAGCGHVEAAKLLELQKQEEARKYYESRNRAVGSTIDTSTLNNANRGFSILR